MGKKTSRTEKNPHAKHPLIFTHTPNFARSFDAVIDPRTEHPLILCTLARSLDAVVNSTPCTIVLCTPVINLVRVSATGTAVHCARRSFLHVSVDWESSFCARLIELYQICSSLTLIGKQFTAPVDAEEQQPIQPRQGFSGRPRPAPAELLFGY